MSRLSTYFSSSLLSLGARDIFWPLHKDFRLPSMQSGANLFVETELQPLSAWPCLTGMWQWDIYEPRCSESTFRYPEDTIVVISLR